MNEVRVIKQVDKMLATMQEQLKALQTLRVHMLQKLYPQFHNVPAMAESEFKREFP